ncbi:hypothetical protein BDQ17DRAFT_1332737 [Cyathus striatus]|nr:hypothetical protein BDQ17DRAFT_1332737 [Cyathus striatus]
MYTLSLKKYKWMKAETNEWKEIVQVYEAVRELVHLDLITPAEIFAGFNIDASCCAHDAGFIKLVPHGGISFCNALPGLLFHGWFGVSSFPDHVTCYSPRSEQNINTETETSLNTQPPCHSESKSHKSRALFQFFSQSGSNPSNPEPAPSFFLLTQNSPLFFSNMSRALHPLHHFIWVTMILWRRGLLITCVQDMSSHYK